ncbi:uncharacterized protein MONOS_6384 [Monocercomonoides exilis]|uniref:uncharacterized protein n=1 Tax=Monocercomonoides exilis TaxID=2049356 RepID=UPI0035599E8C|nr:hypothetical protein MONOS_6384 [Monocercomonoides exilis]|eukprot:MONOS_6384.1-p1 / transcript=MONOS_6384.1 / gene=MONOS_6384 / organism=Monocercomonoides_exilis_PA203 / gene_product=unspecified product / transcript_product=unspecified product / location=Mono_scaffold00200:62943-63227(-) / protein_length=95 / sequence_SO=supercontig / SO=protein_coding / is_pseudo=false
MGMMIDVMSAALKSDRSSLPRQKQSSMENNTASLSWLSETRWMTGCGMRENIATICGVSVGKDYSSVGKEVSEKEEDGEDGKEAAIEEEISVKR